MANDFAGSGIPYWPISLSLVHDGLKRLKQNVVLVDLVADSILNFESNEKVLFQGKNPNCLNEKFLSGFDIVVVYAMNYAGHNEILRTVNHISKTCQSPIFVLQNTQAVTGYQFTNSVIAEFKASGAFDVLIGNPQNAVNQICGLPNPKSHDKKVHLQTLWTKEQIDSYNTLPYSHGPKTGKYVPILTSWGCPYGCDFCVVPSTNSRKWLFRDPESVLEEMSRYRNNYGVTHFQFEDLNPTVDWGRWREIMCLLSNVGGFTYAIVSGTKAETLSLSEIPFLYRSGCRYLSISPESGSKRLMKIIGKHFDHEYAVTLVRALSHNGIRTQACFLIGHPSESLWDKFLTTIYLFRLSLAGIDELAFFTIAPHPGSRLSEMGEIVENRGELVTFSGGGRKLDWQTSFWRKFLIFYYVLLKLVKPIDSIMALKRMLFSRPETKTENLLSRIRFLNRNINNDK
jgi:hypothetical protein